MGAASRDRTLDVLTEAGLGQEVGWGAGSESSQPIVPFLPTLQGFTSRLLCCVSSPEPGASRSLIPPVPLRLSLAAAAFRTKVPLPALTAPGASAPPGGGARMEAVHGGGAGLPGSCLRREAQWVGTSGRNLGSPGQPDVLPAFSGPFNSWS